MSPRWLQDGVAAVGVGGLLRGCGGYALPNVHYDTPTDPTSVFDALIESDGAVSLAGLMAEILLLADDPRYAWMAPYYAYEVLSRDELRAQVTDVPAFLTAVLSKLRGQEASLRQVAQWVGASEPGGCWRTADGVAKVLVAKAATLGLTVVW